jgi:serine/threonine protein phosphatase PrpC
MDQEEFKKHNFEKALTDAFMKLDDNLKSEDFAVDTGSTSCVVFVTKNRIYCANAGDSRAVLFSGGKVLELSHDHKPDNPEEQDRIEKANHMVED